ncbi:MAG: Type II pantothenate kinase [Firmicutes bacterium ADurb.Bin419]|nr:MAG: Type II pantothenate kinase [Firmicutes bacterium ADurb.Bin419]
MPVVIGLDVGGSTTKVVAVIDNVLTAHCLVKANDPITSAFGGVGRLLEQCDLRISDIDKINITGVGATYPKGNILGIKTVIVQEFLSTGLGGLYLAGLEDAIVVSMGTGTAYLHASKDRVKHIIGSGIGGGTLMGLSRTVLNTTDPNRMSAMAANGRIGNIDLSIGDITNCDIPGLPTDITASNFGKVCDGVSTDDTASGIFNMIYQTIGTMSVLASRNVGIKDIVFTGQLTCFEECKKVLDAFSDLYDVNIYVPENAVFATAVGACLVQGGN